MAVPKLVKNGIYSPFALLTCSLFPFAVQAARSAPNARKGIKTILHHFRNKHARLKLRFNMYIILVLLAAVSATFRVAAMRLNLSRFFLMIPPSRNQLEKTLP